MTQLVLGIDIGGTKIAFSLAEADSPDTLRVRWRRPTEPCGDPEADVARIAADCEQLLAELGAAPAQLAAVGVSVPGPLDATAGTVLHPPNLAGWGEVPVGPWLEQRWGRPVHLENDANAAALAEWRFGAGRGLSDVVYLTMSTGVGAGLVLGGRLYRGTGGAAGEIGHAPVEWEGEPCPCGMRGCLEAYCGGAAWTRRLAAVTPADSAVATLAGGAAHARPEHVVEAAGQGDAFALAELARWNDYLARGLTALAFTLAPEVIILGTIATAAGEALCFEPVRAQVRAHVWPQLADAMQIVPAALGAELPYRAGLCVALEGLGPS